MEAAGGGSRRQTRGGNRRGKEARGQVGTEGGAQYSTLNHNRANLDTVVPTDAWSSTVSPRSTLCWSYFAVPPACTPPSHCRSTGNMLTPCRGLPRQSPPLLSLQARRALPSGRHCAPVL